MIAPTYIEPKMHPQEEERLKVLHSLKILDTPPEERYNRITRLASEVFEVPIAYISLVDRDRQWFKATQGMDMCSTDRKTSFCGHAILGDDTMVVPDAAQDPRFAGNPFVIGEPHVRFYAGQPLRTTDKLPMGTLCLVDRKPREFGEDKKRILREMGTLVEHEFRLAHTIEAQEKLIQTQVELLASQDRLRKELASGARYVASLLPKPLNDERIEIEWDFQPSEHLGGDAFNYYWLGADKFVFFLLDVAGHGLEAALLSVSVLDTLRNRSLSGVDFADPSQVLKEMNRIYAMAAHDNMYFTLWYGVYDATKRTLQYATGGHPQAILWRKGDAEKFQLLGNPGHLIGAFQNISFENVSFLLKAGDHLHLFSDGIYETLDEEGNRWSVEDLGKFLGGQSEKLNPREIVDAVKTHRKLKVFQDDVTLLGIRFK